MDIDDADRNWEKSLFPKFCKLAERLASEVQRQSQWHKRMNAHGLNQAGDKTPPQEIASTSTDHQDNVNVMSMR